jgi:hypothetical protein
LNQNFPIDQELAGRRLGSPLLAGRGAQQVTARALAFYDLEKVKKSPQAFIEKAGKLFREFGSLRDWLSWSLALSAVARGF